MKSQTLYGNLFLFCVMIIGSFQDSYAQNRFALVIGNSNYKHMGVLKNPVNDATDMGKLLKQKNFDVNILLDADKRQMEEAVWEFSNRLRQKNSVGLFYFAGHGLAVDRRNYLIPVEVNIKNAVDIKYKGVDAGYVLDQMQAADNDLNMLILDACRNNPFKNNFRGVSRGLAPIQAAKGALILYAASLGELAADGKGRNGLFTTHLMQAINTPGLKVEDAFKQTAVSVNKVNKDQLPWQSGVILGDFYFTINAPKAKTVTITPPAEPGRQAEIEFWNSIKNSTNPAYFKAYLAAYGENGLFSSIAKIKLNELQKPVAKPAAEPQTARLTIRTSPEGARIRILNIGPKYQDGIQLKPGSYHIEVTKAGYQRYLKWLELKQDDLYHSVVLEKQVKTVAARPAASQKSNRPAGGYSTDPYTGMPFVYVKPGCFQMGSDDSDSYSSEKPVHRVCLNKGYYLGKYEVTQAQWQQVMGSNPSDFKGNNRPVENVSWHDVQDFIQKLNRQTGRHYRLPTEAEWEYACRSGGKDQKYCGGNNLNSVAWYDENSGGKIHPVGQKQANGLGIYDMSGNVWEWVQDWYDSDYYGSSPVNDPKGPSGGSYRVFRGGSWYNYAGGSRAAYRHGSVPGVSFSYLGFRLACAG